jgi:PAS domain S-box-containing protein
MLEWVTRFSVVTMLMLQIGLGAGGYVGLGELKFQHGLRDLQKEAASMVIAPSSNELFQRVFSVSRGEIMSKASFLTEVPELGDFEGGAFLSFLSVKSWLVVISILFLVGFGVLINIFVRQLRNLGNLQSAIDRGSKDREIAEQQFKSVWTNSQDGMLLTLEGEGILTVNPAFAKIMNSRVEELEGKSICVLFNNEALQEFYLDVLLNRVREAPGQGISLETRIEWKTGPLDMEVYSVMLDQDHQGKSLVLSVFRDVSAQKSVQNKLREAKEKAEQANLFKTSLLSNISHEIRTPLNGIIGGAEHIKMSRKDDPELQSQLDLILQSGERLLGTINSLLDIAKTEAKKMPVVYTQTDIREFLETIIRPLQAVAIRKGLALNFKFTGPDFNANVDRRFMEMILNNLVSNSIKYTIVGSITVTCEKVDNRIVLEVSDTGVGISKEFQPKMFDPFEQESKGHDRLFEGTGLGLSITRNLVHLMGGKIEIWSIKNEGTRVLVEIPLFET